MDDIMIFTRSKEPNKILLYHNGEFKTVTEDEFLELAKNRDYYEVFIAVKHKS